jgi:hypothetical protein
VSGDNAHGVAVSRKRPARLRVEIFAIRQGRGQYSSVITTLVTDTGGCGTRICGVKWAERGPKVGEVWLDRRAIEALVKDFEQVEGVMA